MKATSNVTVYSSGYEKTTPSGFKFFRTAADTSLEFADIDHTYKSHYGKFPLISCFPFTHHNVNIYEIRQEEYFSWNSEEDFPWICIFARKKFYKTLKDVYTFTYTASGMQLRSVWIPRFRLISDLIGLISAAGHYIVADFAKVSSGSETARMYGPQVQPDSTCLSFWFIFDVHEAATLRVVLNDTSDIAFMTESKLNFYSIYALYKFVLCFLCSWS